MIAAFKIRENFEHALEFAQLVNNCNAFAAEFAGVESEFFYYIKPNEEDRYLFIRTRTQDRDHFIEAVRNFASNLDFEIYTKNETNRLLSKIKLENFK